MERLRNAVVPGLLAAALYYAFFGGGYSIFELHGARAAVESERATLADLERHIDSLRAWADSLEVDDAILERIARERFGMIHEGETLYRFVPTDSVPATRREAPAR